MLARRTKARLSFVLGVAAIALYFHRDAHREASPEWVLIGTASGAGRGLAYDRDVAKVRSSHLHRIGFGSIELLVRRQISDEDGQGYELGVMIGHTVYRLRYGVLGELPE